MRLTIEPTEHFFLADEVMVRMWKGQDDGGNPCIALITAVAFTGQAEVVAENLVSIPPPDAEAAMRWAQRIFKQQEGS